MKPSLRDAEELDSEIEYVCKDIDESLDFFNYIRQFDFGVKDVLKTIDVKKYDDITNDFHAIQFYIAFKKRIDILHSIEYANSIAQETYEDYLLDFQQDDVDNNPNSEEDFENEKLGQISSELLDTSFFLEKIFYGDAISIVHNDLKYARGWWTKDSIRALDMPNIIFANRYNGYFLGGMDNEDHNKVICRFLQGNHSSEDIKKILSIPKGYGWQSHELTKNTIWAEVDLNVPDEILIERFKNWLGNARELHGDAFKQSVVSINRKNSFKPSLIKRWGKLRILAYFDMKILCSFFHQEPTLKQYGDALYFDEYDIDTTEKIRKTAIPLLQEIIEGDCLDDLMRKLIAEDKMPK
ncbi:hypothetical protein HRD68_01290 [Yersinia massiliensis]|uniref:DUF6387 family protein n=1 Tax=Yersinia massiliensis TaxID=419257 RepID=UPI001561F136|nr:DUF6387 family protein [Yersinia massiliensis]QKJ09496.1 hypothetical protein HRD68_01290 [Yersinia massiliensis]